MKKSIAFPSSLVSSPLLAALVFAPACGSTPEAKENSDVSLADYAASLLASDRVGDRGREQLERIARAHGMNRQTLEKLAKEDKHLKIDTEDSLFYACPTLSEAEAVQGFALHAGGEGDESHGEEAEIGVDGEGSFALQTSTQTDAFRLHSRPQATRKILLDFDGHVTTGTPWNSSRGVASIVTPAYDKDGVGSSFSAVELADIKAIWQAVAEDYAAFDVDVTTEDPGNAALTGKGIRISIGGNGSWFGSAGGVAYLNSFGRANTPAFVFSKNLGPDYPKYVWEAVSHEAGHTLGLYHDGTVATGTSAGQAYYPGQGTWAPIMGVGYSKPTTQFDRGEYTNANNKQDDLALITQLLGLVPDDHGSSRAAARAVTGSSLDIAGLIAQRGDLDFFALNLGAGPLALSVSGTAPWTSQQRANVNLKLTLFDAAGTAIASSNPAFLNSLLSTTIAQAGTYYLSVDGVGLGSPTATGFSDYGSLGQYRLTGTLPAR